MKRIYKLHMDEYLNLNSKIISLLRLPLMIGVVFIHSLSLGSGEYMVYDFCYSAITETLCSVCVPLFFFFSGYLFFLNVEAFSLDIYKSKMKRRIRSLLIPYVFWNLFVVAIIGFGQLLVPSLFTGAFKKVSDFSFNDWFSIFYCSLGSTQPIAYQLWFLRDLIIMSALSPLFYCLCRYLKFWWIFVLMVLCVIGTPSIVPGLSFFSLFYYGSGCWFGFYKRSFVIKEKEWRWAVILLYVIVFVIELLLIQHEYSWFHYVHGLNVVVGCVAVVQLTSFFVEHNNEKVSFLEKKSVANSSFFIYCYHGIFASFMAKFSASYVRSDFDAVVCYFAIVVILVVLGVLIYNSLLRVLPRFTSVISGGRK